MVAPAEASATKLLKVLFIRDYFRRWLARFELGAHLLDLSCLFFELCRENLHLFRLQGDGSFQLSDTGLLFLNFFVFFEELVEQQYGDCVVADAVDLPLGITGYQVQVYLGHVFGNQAKLRVIGIVVLPVKRHWLKSQDAFAYLVDRCNVLFESARGKSSIGEPIIAANRYRMRRSARSLVKNTANKGV